MGKGKTKCRSEVGKEIGELAEHWEDYMTTIKSRLAAVERQLHFHRAVIVKEARNGEVLQENAGMGE